MKDSIIKCLNHLNTETSYTNRQGRNRGKWSILSQFCHSKCISKLAAKSVELEEPHGFGTYASNDYYPSWHYDKDVVASWKKAMEIYKETEDIEAAIAALPFDNNTYREGFSENVFYSAVILALSGTTLSDLLPNLFGCSVEQAINEIRDHDLWNGSLTKTHALGDGEWSLEVYSRDDEYLFEFVGSNGTRSESDDLNGQLNLLLDLSE